MYVCMGLTWADLACVGTFAREAWASATTTK